MKFEEVNKIVNDNFTYGETEIGVTHPLNSSFFRIADNGDIQIFADEGFGIIFHKENRSVVFFADSVRFVTRDRGVSINDSIINDTARKFTEPVLLPYEFEKSLGMYEYLDTYLNDDYDYLSGDKIVDPNTKNSITREEYKELYGKDPEWNGEKYV